MDGIVTSYHLTSTDAQAASLAFYTQFGDAADYTMISPPNHDRATYKLEVNYDAEMYRPARRFSDLRAVL